MARRFLRLDLSSGARDFQPVALEPGLPLLDRQNANYRTLRKWLGRWVAEPEWHGNSVDLYVCDAQNDRLADVRCERIAADDLKRSKELMADFQELSCRLEQIKPEPKEAKLHEAIVRHFHKVIADAAPGQKECHFFRYRDASGWRIVWGWGYQRKDPRPAAPTICTNPACGLLFVRHVDGSRNCPACESIVEPEQKKVRKSRRMPALLMLLAVVLGAIGYGAWEYLRRAGKEVGLEAQPAQWTVPVGGQVGFVIKQRAPDGKEEDVTAQVVAVVENPQVLRLDRAGCVGKARSTGRTAVYFYLGNDVVHATVEVQPAKLPAKIYIEPAELTLGVGTTSRLRVWGEFDDGVKHELTDAAEWEPVVGGGVSCYCGRVEGMAEVERTVSVRYRASPEDPYRRAEAKVKVVAEKYRAIELAVNPNAIKNGRYAGLEAYAVTESGEKRSVLQSSQLSLAVEPAALATLEEDCRYLRAVRTGRGKLKASFRQLNASQEFRIERDDGAQPYHATPNPAVLAVDQVLELQVTTNSADPIRLTSSAPEIVEVLPGCRLVGRSEGKAEVAVSQEARQAKIAVEVVRKPIRALAIVPGRISVPMDRSVAFRLTGRCDNGEEIDLASDSASIAWEQVPTPTVAELNPRTLEILGRRPTGETPETLTARFGGLRATAQVDVMLHPPLQVELTPAGPVSLPVGQSARLQAWATYGDGRRLELAASQVEWKHEPAGKVAGLEFNEAEGTLHMTQPAVGPVTVRASYQGIASSPVEFRSVEQPFTLLLDADRSVFLVKDAGKFTAAVENGAPDVSVEGVSFETSDPKVLTVDPRSGAYQAAAAGRVTVTAKHPKAKSPAKRAVEVLPPEKADLVFRPAEIKLTVDGRQPLELYLVAGGQEQPISLLGEAGGAQLNISNDAVQWKAPALMGVAATGPFEITADYGGKTAHAKVEVIKPTRPEDAELRFVPDAVTLAPNQPLTPRLEQRSSADGGQGMEIDPSKATWTLPEDVRWQIPPDGTKPAELILSESAKGSVKVVAAYGRATATLTINVKAAPPTDGPLEVVRTPCGERLPVHQQQSYRIAIRNGDKLEPAANVQWQPAFENDFVRWAPPILEAKQPGHQQRLEATVGSQRIGWSTRTTEIVECRPKPGSAPPEKPNEVRFVTNQKQPIVIADQAEFTDYRVEAEFPGGKTRDVTREASLSVDCSDPKQPPVIVKEGRLCAERPGTAKVQANFRDVPASAPLVLEVGNPTLTSLEIEPNALELEKGRTREVRVKGYSGSGDSRAMIGDVTDRPDLKWEIDRKDIVRVDGPALTGLAAGEARVTVSAGSATGAATVRVAPDGGEVKIEIEPKPLGLRVGETKQIGTDLTIRQGGAIVRDSFGAASTDTSVVRYNANDRSIVGVAPGRADLLVTVGGQTQKVPITVVLVPGDSSGRIVIEPSSGKLAVGELANLRVIVETTGGERIDRTGSAILHSADLAVLGLAGSRMTAIAPGSGTITAQLPNIKEPATATFEVTKENFTGLAVTPPSIRLRPEEEQPVHVFGMGPGGRRELSLNHPDLHVELAGESPNAARWRGEAVRGVVPGKAALRVNFAGLRAEPDPVPIEIFVDKPAELRIEPPEATVAVGRKATFLVFAVHDDQERSLSSNEVQLQVADESVGKPDRDLTVVGGSCGMTQVTAMHGGRRAVALLRVTPPDDEIPKPGGLRFLPDFLTLELGVPGASVRLVRNRPDGQEEDVDHRAKIEVSNPDVCSVSWTASGPIFKALKEGEAEATASLGSLTTQLPLKIRVVDEPARLDACPDPVRLIAGKTGGFDRVQLVPQGGGTPINIDFRVKSKDPKVVAVEGDKTLRGVSVGQAQVEISPVNLDARFAKLSTTATVEVSAEPSPPPQLKLLLTGPSQTCVGSEVNYRVELVGEGYRKDVTNEGAELVLNRDQAGLAEIKPGCILAAKNPGTIPVRARHQDLNSNVVPLRIDVPETSFERLVLEIDTKPLTFKETRPYKVWGYPSGGRPKQDLTRQVNATGQGPNGPVPCVAMRVTDPKDGDIVEHNPPTVKAKDTPGHFQLVATLKPSDSSELLRSEIVDLAILQDDDGPKELRAQPSSMAVRVGETTPRIQAMKCALGQKTGRCADAKWSSENEALLAANPQAAGTFIGKAPGKTRLKGTAGDNLTAFIDVTVLDGDPFRKVVIPQKGLEFKPQNRCTVLVQIEGNQSKEEGWEYRAVTVGDPDQGEWKAATSDGNRIQVELMSPVFRLAPRGEIYHLQLEARKAGQNVVARYPLTFQIEPYSH